MIVPDQLGRVERAYDDLSRRSLSKIDGDLARLIYLASTRDYNTGKYHHAGLAARFQEEIANQVLELAHRDTFSQIAARSLEDTVKQVETYVSSSPQSREEILHAWQQLEPYRVAIPVDVNIAVAQLFVSNIKLALAILRQRYRRQQLAASTS
jgi:methionyl-tRNA synthetase